MGYQAKLDRRKPTNPWDDDEPDFVDLTETEEFEMLRDTGMKASEFRDKEKGKRYAAWLEKNPASEE
jgi:hypothetical protein